MTLKEVIDSGKCWKRKDDGFWQGPGMQINYVFTHGKNICMCLEDAIAEDYILDDNKEKSK